MQGVSNIIYLKYISMTFNCARALLTNPWVAQRS